MEENKGILARVGSKEITREDVFRFIQGMGKDASQFMNEAGFKLIANEIINQELLYNEALREGLDKEDSFLKEIELAKKNILINIKMKKIFDSVSVSDDEVREYFDSHRDSIKSSYSYNADHILVNDEKTAREIYEKVNSDNFSELAREYSTCPSKERGGNLGDFESGQMVKEFDLKLQEMEEGEISEPVKTEFGYHIIKLNKKKLIRQANFENMKDQLKNQLTLMKGQEKYKEETGNLEKDFDVERYF